jgi:hypothetical protein
MSQLFLIRTTTKDDWERVRELRIENATDNPISYGATLEYTLHMTESDWRLRAKRGDSPDTTSVAAIERASGRCVGMMSAQHGDVDGGVPGTHRGVRQPRLARPSSWHRRRALGTRR